MQRRKGQHVINVGVIGCGSIARMRHAVEYSNNKDVKIMGFTDFNKDRAQDMADDFGGKVYLSDDEMLKDENIDAVSVCVANAYHAEITIKALNHGKHVLCEKPMAITLDDCEKMQKAAKENERRLMIGHNQRFAPAHQRAKEILESGEMGKVISFTTTFGHKGPEMWSVDKGSNTWFFKKSAAAFGSMADLGIHKIDLMRYLIGGKVDNVYSTLATLDKKFSDGTPIEVDDNSIELIKFENGALGTVTTSWTHYGEECNATTLYCEKGIMYLYSNPQYSLEIVHENGEKESFELDKIQTNDDDVQVNSGVIDTFIGGIARGKKTIIDAEEAIESMKVVFACLESSQKGCMVKL